MSIRKKVPLLLAVAFALPLLLFHGRASGEALTTPARQILLDARAMGGGDAAEIAKTLQPVSQRTIAELRILLGDQDAAVRAMAVGVLAALGDHPFQTLLRLLRDDDKTVRQAAENVLSASGPPAVEPVGEFFLAESCLSEAKRTAARILGRIGDPAGIPYLTSVLIKYKTGGFPQEVGMQALKAMGSPLAIGQLLQLILLSSRDLGKEAYLALLTLDADALVRILEGLIADPSEDIEMRFFYAGELNEIAGTGIAAPILAKFYGQTADNPQLADEARKKGATLRNLFSQPNEEGTYYRKPLTPQRLNAMYALKKEDEESPYIEERRRKEQEMDKIREERRRANSGWGRMGGFVIIPGGNR